MPYTTLVAATTITASWANSSVRDQTVVPFATAAARDAAITSPVAGMVEYLTTNLATEGLTTRTSANTWRLPWNMPWGVLSYNTLTATTVSLGGTTHWIAGTTFAAVANRRLRITAQASEFVTVGTGVTDLQVWSQGTNQIASVDVTNGSVGAATYNGAVCIGFDSPAAGNIYYELVTFTNATSVSLTASGSAPIYLVVEDIGPSGVPA